MTAIETENQRRCKERMAAYNIVHREEINAAMKGHHMRHTPEKRAAMTAYNEEHRDEINQTMRKLYKDPDKREEKKEAMAAYNEKHRENINLAMRENIHIKNPYLPEFECPICKNSFYYKKTIDSHIKHHHSENEPSFTCQICEKNFGYKANLERHMNGVKHVCSECPAAFTRKAVLEKHIRVGWHYLSYYCKQCKKTLVFKHLGGLIEHVIVKQSEGEDIGSDGTKWKQYKSGILVTCKSQVESTQLKEGKHVLCMPRKEKVEAAKKGL